MSRSGYNDDLDNWDLIRWRGAVASAIGGKRGQAFLRELLAALDAMPKRALIAEELEDENGDRCAMGELGHKRGLDLQAIDPEDPEAVANAFGIACCLAREISYENDEHDHWGQDADGRWRITPETCEQRWERMRAWVKCQLKIEELT
jgi:hypothetical protein